MVLKNSKITLNRLKEVLNYDVKSGIFTRALKVNRNTVVGSVAGTINPNGYRYILVDRNKFLAHRLAWLYVNGEMPSAEIDHIDHDRDNNSIDNLRKVTRGENCRNTSKSKRNTSGVVGIGWSKRDSRWVARIYYMGKTIHLGNFKDFDDAVEARKKAEVKRLFHENHGA